MSAFRYLNEYEQIVEGCSDDGEPRGTSGKPSLAVLSGYPLINIALICVRYFGGTKLGTGGLVRAYGEAVKLVVEQSELIEYEKEHLHVIEFSYSSTTQIEYILDKYGVKIVTKNFNANGAAYEIKAPINSLNHFYDEASRLVIN